MWQISEAPGLRRHTSAKTCQENDLGGETGRVRVSLRHEAGREEPSR